MGGYELLADPVPASLMVYDHVARGILPSFEGQQNSFPATVSSGDAHVLTFLFNIDPSWDIAKMHIIGMLIDDNGKIDNVGKTTIEEAVSNGYLSITDAPIVDHSVKSIYPNPTNATSFIDVNTNGAVNVTMTVTDIHGKVVSTRNYGKLAGDYKLPIETSLLSNGVYIVKTTIGGQTNVQKLSVK